MSKIKRVPKTVEMNTGLTPFFSGTYESIWEVREYDDNSNELEVNYSHKDLMKSIAEYYANDADFILDELDMPFIKSIKFKGTFYSPREYNFSTDVLDYVITLNKAALKRTLTSLKDNKELEKFLYENYTSCDGFISSTPNNYDELVFRIAGEGYRYEQALAALMNFLTRGDKNNRGAYESIEEHIQDRWQGNGYGSLDYTVVEQESVTA